MRKILRIISIVCIAFSLLTLAMIIDPGMIDWYNDGIGFLCMFVSIICSGLVLLAWVIFSSTKSDKYKKLQIISSISSALITVLYTIFIAQMVLSIIALSLCIGYSKKQSVQQPL